VRETPAGTWVDGYFFDDTKLKDQRPLAVHDLDEVSKEHPVVVHHRGGHTSFYNTKALEAAGITKTTPNPAGGTFDRDENGDLNGRVTDLARSVFANVGKRPTYTADQAMQRDRDGLAYISKQCVRYELDERAPRGRQSPGAAAAPRPRRPAAPRQLRSERPRARVDDRGRHGHRPRR
jgi:hypothetical protein